MVELVAVLVEAVVVEARTEGGASIRSCWVDMTDLWSEAMITVRRSEGEIQADLGWRKSAKKEHKRETDGGPTGLSSYWIKLGARKRETCVYYESLDCLVKNVDCLII